MAIPSRSLGDDVTGTRGFITARLRRLQRLPHLVRGFFGDPELAYITAVA
jgi:hypothetical protein